MAERRQIELGFFNVFFTATVPRLDVARANGRYWPKLNIMHNVDCLEISRRMVSVLDSIVRCRARRLVVFSPFLWKCCCAVATRSVVVLRKHVQTGREESVGKKSGQRENKRTQRSKAVNLHSSSCHSSRPFDTPPLTTTTTTTALFSIFFKIEK